MPVIQVENLSKRFIIQHEGGNAGKYVALRDVIAEKVKGLAKRKETIRQEEFWALRDVSFNIEQGDRIGIIGRNGAGKSTLLKILSRITEPTSGVVKIKGRVASLLEVGTGFHPELTGRENVFLNGAILGMSRAEVRSKFDEIVAFAEIEKFLDTPVKRYSSGMYVRLAFAVAAHLEPEILVVDEVLAVGDAQFQKKCLGKMSDVSKGEGRTVLFVSHDMRAIKALCNQAVFLKLGQTKGLQPINDAISEYSFVRDEVNSSYPVTLDELIIHGFNVTQNNVRLEEFESELPIEISLEFELKEARKNFRVGVFLRSVQGELIASPLLADWDADREDLGAGKYVMNGKIPAYVLLGNHYSLEMHSSIHGMKNFGAESHARQIIKVKSPSNYNLNHISEQSYGHIILNANWSCKRI